MKTLLFLTLVLLSFNLLAIPADFHGYLRSGVGNNLSPKKQTCFSNSGTTGNEFRLGNECGTYGELSTSFEFLDKNDKNQSFKIQTTAAFFPSENTQYGDESSQNDVDIVETFAQSRNLEGAPFTFWVGKRFYRDVDVYMNDFYYFAAMNGVGAGVSDIILFGGNFKVAYLQETQTSTANSDKITKSYLDFRLFDLKISDHDQLNFWASVGFAPKGTIGTTNYEKLNGELFGIRWRKNLASGFNDFAIIYGQKLLSSINVYGNAEIKSGFDNQRKYTIRAVEHITSKISDKVELHASATLEQRNNGSRDSTWWNAGLRPVYFINDNLRFVTELGHSEVLSTTKSLTLTRLTVAYEIAINNSIWARPVIRAYATESFWSKDNRSNFNNKKEGHAVGFQTEVWF
jgi:maltoporin